MGDNRHEVKKICPVVGDECLGDRCRITYPMSTGTMPTNMCFFDAVILMLSQINQKTVMPQPQGIQIPGLFRK